MWRLPKKQISTSIETITTSTQFAVTHLDIEAKNATSVASVPKLRLIPVIWLPLATTFKTITKVLLIDLPPFVL